MAKDGKDKMNKIGNYIVGAASVICICTVLVMGAGFVGTHLAVIEAHSLSLLAWSLSGWWPFLISLYGLGTAIVVSYSAVAGN
jgi:hypothetical protein